MHYADTLRIRHVNGSTYHSLTENHLKQHLNVSDLSPIVKVRKKQVFYKHIKREYNKALVKLLILHQTLV